MSIERRRACRRKVVKSVPSMGVMAPAGRRACASVQAACLPWIIVSPYITCRIDKRSVRLVAVTSGRVHRAGSEPLVSSGIDTAPCTTSRRGSLPRLSGGRLAIGSDSAPGRESFSLK